MAKLTISNEAAKEAENIVADFLTKKGYTILERNWRPGPQSKLEIDLIAMKDMRVVFTEVKARSGKGNDPIEAVDKRKINNICKAADSYLRQQPYLYEYRFDIAGVIDPLSSSPKVEYIENAFLPPFGKR